MFKLVYLSCTAAFSCIVSHLLLQMMFNQEIARQLCMEHQLLFSKAVTWLTYTQFALYVYSYGRMVCWIWYEPFVGIIWWQLPIYGSRAKVSEVFLVEKGKYFEFLKHLLSLCCRECGLAHKTVIFILDEFDLFAQVRLQYIFPSDCY